MQLLMMAAYRSEKYESPSGLCFRVDRPYDDEPGEKKAKGEVREKACNTPHTMYGCEQIDCETGRVLQQINGQKHLDDDPAHILDFRPSFSGPELRLHPSRGGTSDYSRHHHAAAQGNRTCVRARGSRYSFMAMPQAIKSCVIVLDARASK